MIIKEINFSPTELNTASGIVKAIADYTPVIKSIESRNYRPTTIIFPNKTGGQIGYNLFTDEEYATWLNSGAVSSWLLLDNGDTDTISPAYGEISQIVVQGTSGHVSALVSLVIQEPSGK